ncbi:hypothetical protein AOQ73_25365 [Bradyrhizobium pachyrhizi]|nr:hypothetical protein AOQ73_25365 [Bradyrhizobium pachyrhizi]
MEVHSSDAAILGAIIDLVDDIPIELLTISGKDYTALVVGLESMRAAIDRWNHHGTDQPPRMYEGKSPIYVVRSALSKCPDQMPDPATTELAFVKDPSLRLSIRLDIGSASEALHRGDFKAATVLAGAAIEALLLWAIQKAGITQPVAAMTKGAKGPPENWMLAHLIEAAELLSQIKPETAQQCRQAKDFRNLIHPGKSQRLAVSCDRGTALAALSGAELVARDLQ